MANKGTATVDFGAAPGAQEASVAVSSPTIATGSRVEAWLERPAAASADHVEDEHLIEDLHVVAGSIVDSVGFTIYAKCNTGNAHGAFTVAWVWV